MRKLLMVAAACLVLGACASGDTTVAHESPSVREYPTGSNIPRKGPQNPKDENIQVRTREDLERIQNSGHGVPSVGSGLPR